ncbi:putative iron-sulfur protein [Sphingobium sp. SYK-6]|uniref:aromatic ring-hydroxylating dioxygenase subunit alpha n=1 Tax=Sphingobium sp. (strain NBRC 103272 / SYK-6) TaxID=627192 RepID=UPI00022773BE|nr:aromatic ring-hydroxylating dioxygenase subunit alpha [Sphingobium sp. SYK-6]BAK66528.1 putative iron-sulfur protein [Sphingobium sp. SYK-6]
MGVYLKNVWYAAAFADEISDKPLARTLLDQEIMLFRKGDGTAAMLADRCPHRFAPLSGGKVIGDEIQCPYHGLRFNAQGECTHNPHVKGGGALKAANITAWPVMEKYGILWFWPGNPDLAEPSALPRVEFLERPDAFSVVKGLLHVKGNYELVVDNLLDLSHASYIHPQFGGSAYSPEQLLAATTQKLERRENSIVNHRVRSGLAAPAPSQALFGYDAETPVYTKSTMTWYPPSMLDFDAGSWAMDEAEEDGAHIPQLHFITPETEFTSHYFFVNGRNQRRDDPQVDAALLEMFDVAFHRQDEPMIEAVQRRMGGVSDINELNPILLQTDAAPVSARRMLASLIRAEKEIAGPMVVAAE